MTQIVFSLHANQQMRERGATIREVKETILEGEKVIVVTVYTFYF